MPLTPLLAAVAMAAAALQADAVRVLAHGTTSVDAGGAARPRVQEPRFRVTLNDGWHYAPGDTAPAAAVDDRMWESVDLPHTWNADPGITETLTYRRGVGWYRRPLVLDRALRGRRLFLHFEGVNQVADVYVNDRPAGRHVGGYTGFTFDITDLVRFDQQNVIAVRVDNRHDEDIPPLNADFTFYGGIYRDVWLIATAPLHIDLLDHGSAGVFVDTPDIAAGSARVRVHGVIVNHTVSARDIVVRSRIYDPDGREVMVLRSTLRVPAAGRASFDMTSEPTPAPRLWSPETPALYHVRTEVVEGADPVDAVDVPLGFRWFEVDPQRGFSLNGEWRQLAGTNRHQDRAGLGNALGDELHREDVALIRRDGFDFLRLAHYPQDPAVLDAADRAGLIVWEEIPVVNEIRMTEAFAQNAERMLVEMIRQHYNHPSVVFWGYMNEVLLREPQPPPPEYRPAVLALARRLEARAKAEDPYRLTAMAISFDEIDNGSGVQDVADVLGLNLYFGWYYRHLAGFGAYLDSLHARHPLRPLLISEYGAGSDERVHADSGVAFDFSSEYQRRFHEETYPQIRARSYLAGSAVWNHFDFGSAHRQDTKPALNQKGLRFHDRSAKDVVHYYRALLRPDPVLHIATDEHLQRAGSDEADARQSVVVYSGLPRVELLMNGASLGTRTVVNGRAAWAVTFRHGANSLTARNAAGTPGPVDVALVHYDDRSPLFGRGNGLPRPDDASIVIAVNAGAHYEVIDESGLVWEADRPYSPGGWGYLGGRAERTHHRIAGTVLEPLFQSVRAGMDAYRFDVPAGEYELTLGFTEIRPRPDASRVFEVVVNGRSAGEPVDPATRPVTAIRRTVRVSVAGDQGIEIRFVPRHGEPAVAAIQLRRLLKREGP